MDFFLVQSKIVFYCAFFTELIIIYNYHFILMNVCPIFDFDFIESKKKKLFCQYLPGLTPIHIGSSHDLQFTT